MQPTSAHPVTSCRTAVATPPLAHARRRLTVACSASPHHDGAAVFHNLVSQCTASVQQFLAAATQVPHPQQQQQRNTRQWQQSFGIGAGGLSAAACSGTGGGSGPPNSSSWGSGGGGSGWGPAPNGTGLGSNVLADVAAAGEVADAAAAVEEVVLLDVGGMKCGGCVGHVKQLLEQHAAVTAATVNLATETALVRVRLEAGADLGRLAADLAKVLSKAGFPSTVRPRRGNSWVCDTAAVSRRRQQKLDKLQKATHDLAVAWGLSLLCGLGHLGHVWAGAPAWLHALHHPVLGATLSAAALLGPGRDIITSGWQVLSAGRPDMNSLVGLGATASFAVSCVAAALPALRWKTFFEEPAMLLGFVLVGRALEERAKLQASSDMAALQGLMPQTARLTLHSSTAAAPAGNDPSSSGSTVGSTGSASPYITTTSSSGQQAAAGASTSSSASSSTGGSSSSSCGGVSWVEVPADAVGPGDVLLVLPGDRVPVDGTVVSGRSTVDESALTGEPLPLVKQQGAKVTAGTLNCDGSLLVTAQASGQDTVIADIVRMVEAAQARTAPIQRLADSVAGKFAYGVMGLSAATFAFWSTAGARLFPNVLAAATAGGGSIAGAAAAGACCCPPAAGAAGAGAAGAAAAAAASGGAGAAAAAVPAAAAVLLGLQLACNVLVVACPCALGLATPTAVLVGSAAGARKGLLVRGGDILEATAQVDTVVFDKTGTLTAGRPVVAGITMLQQGLHLPSGSNITQGSSSSTTAPSSSSSTEGVLTPGLMLQLVAAVERQATHPVAKALVAAAAADHTAALEGSSSSSSSVAAEGAAEQQQLLQERRASHAAAGPNSSSSQQQHFRGQHKRNSNNSSSSSTSKGSSSFLTPEAAAVLAAGGQLQPDAGSFLQEPGSGAVAAVAGHKVSVGTLEWVQRHGAQLAPGAEQLLQNSSSGSSGSNSSGSSSSEPLTGHTQVYVGVDGVVVGVVDVADVIRPDARSTVQELHDQGIKTIMLSGDRAEAAAKVAAAVGISPPDVHAGIKPAGKAALVEQLKAAGHRVAMVGDGINDTAALAAADVGMAMAGGVDAASDVAKVVLMGDQLHQVCDAIELSRKTLSKIQQNLGWAFCYNLVGIPLAAGALLPSHGLALTPSLSGALMGFSSLAVMLNSLALQWEVRGLRNGLVTAQRAAAAHPAAAAAMGGGAWSDGGSGGSGWGRGQQQQQQKQATAAAVVSGGSAAEAV